MSHFFPIALPHQLPLSIRAPLTVPMSPPLTFLDLPFPLNSVYFLKNYSLFILNFISIVDTITDVPIPPLCPPPRSPCLPSLWPSPHCRLCLWVVHTCSLADPFTSFHPVLPLPPPQQLSVCSKLSVVFIHQSLLNFQIMHSPSLLKENM